MTANNSEILLRKLRFYMLFTILWIFDEIHEGGCMVKKTAYLVLAISILAAGCATKPMQGAFEQLTYEGSRLTTGVASYHSLMSISGLIPHHAPGSYFLEADSHLHRAAPTLLSGISSGCSYVVTSKFPEGSMEDVFALRNAYIDVRDKSAAVVSALVRRSMLQKAIRAEEAGEKAADMKTELIVGAARITETAKPKEELPSTSAHMAQAELALATARSELSLATSALRNALRPNYLITTWASEETDSVGASVGQPNQGGVPQGIGASQQRQRKGILVLGGLKVRSLVVGQDFKQMLIDLREKKYGGIQTASQMSNVGITTLAIEARHVAYISEMDLLQEVAATLGLSKADLLKGLEPDTQLQVSFALRAAESISNAAAFSGPEISTEKMNFLEDKHTSYVLGLTNRAGGYMQVYVVRANLTPAGILLLGQNENVPECARPSHGAMPASPP